MQPYCLVIDRVPLIHLFNIHPHVGSQTSRFTQGSPGVQPSLPTNVSGKPKSPAVSLITMNIKNRRERGREKKIKVSWFSKVKKKCDYPYSTFKILANLLKME